MVWFTLKVLCRFEEIKALELAGILDSLAKWIYFVPEAIIKFFFCGSLVYPLVLILSVELPTFIIIL